MRCATAIRPVQYLQAQVVMDILGVAISCTCSTFVLDQLSTGLGM